jgi:hypothetical protein
VGPLIEVRGYKLNGSVTAPSLLTTTASGEYYLGMVTVGADIKIAPTPWMEIDSVISAIPVGGLGRVVDADAAAKYFFHKNVSVQGGYRFLRLRVSDGPNLAELRIQGPFIGMGFRF